MEFLFLGLIKLLGSAGFGSVFGGLMGWLNRKSDLDVKKLELEDRDRQRAHELKQRELDGLILEKEYASRVHVAEAEAFAKVEQAGYAAMTESYKFAQPEKGSKMANFSAFVRPFISISYFIVSTVGCGWILHRVFATEGLTFDSAQWFELAHFIITWVAFMSGTTIGYYYSMRPGAPPQAPRKLN